ncbi:hypothetical protein ACFC0D_16915 [Streptomyces sp. NPDC056222]|uniref:hypothetical protein n=1 Tax=Streptomyces sp. NPDC056222 TaxID=3345749 RepID=UPI0035DB062D
MRAHVVERLTARSRLPLGKVVNRFETGPEESVQRFCLLLHGRTRTPVRCL